MKRTLWMAVSNDEYELPIAVGDSATELADMLGIKARSIYSYFCDSHANNRKRSSKYIKVEIDDDDEGQFCESPDNHNGAIN